MIRTENRTAEGRSPTASAAANAARFVGRYRWTICALLFFSTTINYMDRQILGLLKHELTQDLGWTEQGYANIVTAFQFAYAFGYLFGGRLMDRIGVKRGLPLAAFFWSVAAAAHGLVRSIAGFSIARLGLGLAEGGNFPAAIKAVGEWFPVRERALATGIFNCGSTVGAIVCPLLVPWIAAAWGWPATFYITGALGLVWIVAWALLYDSPEKSTRLSAAERAYIEGGRAPVAAAAAEPGVPYLELLRSRSVWAYMLAGLLTGPVWWFYLFWIPDFLQKRFDLTLQQIALPVAVIYFMTLFGSVGGGWMSARLLAAGRSVDAARKISLLVCALCVLPVFAAGFLPSLWGSVFVVGLAASAHQGWSANLYTFVSDTMPKRAVSSVVGLGGLVSGIAGMGTAQLVGWVLTATGSYVPLFVAASTLYLIGLLALHLLVPRIEPVASIAASEAAA